MKFWSKFTFFHFRKYKIEISMRICKNLTLKFQIWFVFSWNNQKYFTILILQNFILGTKRKKAHKFSCKTDSDPGRFCSNQFVSDSRGDPSGRFCTESGSEESILPEFLQNLMEILQNWLRSKPENTPNLQNPGDQQNPEYCVQARMQTNCARMK